MAAGLLLMAALLLAGLADGLTVGDAGSLEADLHAELVLQLGLDHIEVLLAQTADDLLVGLRVVDVAQGGVFLHQTGQSAADLALVALLGHSEDVYKRQVSAAVPFSTREWLLRWRPAHGGQIG